ncbi:MAG: nuclear transport factor 2 family protein [Paucibacter sp.]|nr:nuclear transport factor 2 family protein [Roseateles sp.]
MNHSTPIQVLDAYKNAVYDADADAFLRLYDPAARVFDTWGVWSYEGVAARRQAIEGWLSSLGDERVVVSFDDVMVIVDLELAVLTATGRYAAVSTSGVELRSMQNRFTWALKRKGDGEGWLIVHEHTSAPIGFGDLKGILQRDGA